MKLVIKRLASLALCLILLAGLSVSAFAAEDKAASIVLAKTQGTVVVTNNVGLMVTLTEGAHLYSGYTISTAAASYAWLSLDDTSLVKLDGLSRVKIIVSGKKLRVQLDTGNLFFDVPEPLAADQSLEISTSTMVTGIRGTAGIVSIGLAAGAIPVRLQTTQSIGAASLTPVNWQQPEGQQTTITLLQGQVSTSPIQPQITGGTAPVPIGAGQTGLVAGQNVTVGNQNLGQALNDNPFAAQETLGSGLGATLQQEGLLTDQDNENLLNNLGDNLEEAEKRQLEQEMKNLTLPENNPDPTQYFTEPTGDTTGDAGGADGQGTGSEPQPEPGPDADTQTQNPPAPIGSSTTVQNHTVRYWYPVYDDDRLTWELFGSYTFQGTTTVAQPYLQPAVTDWPGEGSYWTSDLAAIEAEYETGAPKPDDPAGDYFASGAPKVSATVDLYWYVPLAMIPE